MLDHAPVDEVSDTTLDIEYKRNASGVSSSCVLPADMANMCMCAHAWRRTCVHICICVRVLVGSCMRACVQELCVRVGEMLILFPPTIMLLADIRLCVSCSKRGARSTYGGGQRLFPGFSGCVFCRQHPPVSGSIAAQSDRGELTYCSFSAQGVHTLPLSSSFL